MTLQTVALLASLAMGFSRQEYWSMWPCPPPGNLPDPSIEPASLMPPALAGRFFTTAAAAAKSHQSCPTLCDPMDCSPPGSSVQGILQAEYWSGLPSPPPAAAAKSPQSCPTLCDPIDGSHQAPPSLGFSRQEHWSGLPFPSPMQESEK